MSAHEELKGIAGELLLRLEWARARGETSLPIARPGAQPALPREVAARREALPPAEAQAPAEAPAPHEPSEIRQSPLVALREELGDCQRCRLSQGRRKLVFGAGSPEARLLFVGEGPGMEEDQQGLPFVGPAGQLLTKMIAAMGLRREEVYICNVIKCRPPENRNPEPDEVEACAPFLAKQIAAVSPEVIVTLGKFAAQTLLRSQEPISRLRGRWHRYQGIDLLPTFHPAYLLRSPQEKRKAWEDLQQVMKKLGLQGPK